MKKGYEQQDRGGVNAYESYFAGMDRSMQQKVALTTAYFPTRGQIADMGSGSGRGTYDLACLYDGLELIGVDINPVSVEYSCQQYQRQNLRYVVGDIAERVLPEGSLDGILDSSVLHHVTSFNNYDLGRVFTTLNNQVFQLREGGVIIIRDFVIPDGPKIVHLDLPTDDGIGEGSVKNVSTAALFEVFARDFRSSVNRDGPVPFVRRDSGRAGFARYEVALRAAAEFVLRKDYRNDWDAELIEEYTYLSKEQFEAAFRERGLRIVTSMPLWNPWIVENRFKGKFNISTLDGEALPFPPTNYLIVGEKVAGDIGVELVEKACRVLSSPKFLSIKAYRHRDSGRVYELAERPNLTIDLVPWFEIGDQVFVLAKKDFPRPIVNAALDQPQLNLSTLSGYITEPITAIVDPAEETRQAVERILRERAGVAADDILDIGSEFAYFTSPGGINERVAALLVKIRPWSGETHSSPNYTRFTSAGEVRELDAVQVLRAAKVSGLFDARLEVNIYRLLRLLGRSAGPWIGAPIDLSTQTDVGSFSSDPSVLRPERRTAFQRVDPPTPTQFLSLRDATFAELDRSGAAIAAVDFEYVVPATLSKSTVVALPVLKLGERIVIGLDHRDLPAVQHFIGSSAITVAPAWRLPRSVKRQSDLEEFLRSGIRREFALSPLRTWELGGAYFATPGLTPETVYPMAVECEAAGATDSPLLFIELDELMGCLDLVQDAHLLISACRLGHALGRLSP